MLNLQDYGYGGRPAVVFVFDVGNVSFVAAGNSSGLVVVVVVVVLVVVADVGVASLVASETAILWGILRQSANLLTYPVNRSGYS